MKADDAEKAVRQTFAAAGKHNLAVELVLCAPRPISKATGKMRGRRANQKTKRGKYKNSGKRAKNMDLTADFHAKVFAFGDLAGAIGMVRDNFDRIDLNHHVRIKGSENQRGGSPALPALQHVLWRYQSTALRLRKPEALILAQELVRAGADVNQIGNFPVTNLQFAVVLKSFALIRSILQAGADPQTVNSDGSALHRALGQRETGLLTQGVPGVPQDPFAPPSGPLEPSQDPV